MKLKPPQNENYAATVVRVNAINTLANRDFIVGVPLLGYQAIVPKDVQIGDLGVVFTAETQLSPRYAAENNLHRHWERNVNQDPDKIGYLEDTRRVKAIKFAGHRSDALFMPLESLRYTGVDVTKLKEGDTFDEINGEEVCRKYVIRVPRDRGIRQRRRFQPRVDEVLFPKHFDTENYFRHVDDIKPGQRVIITQKLHGTSLRVGHVLVRRKLPWYDKVAKWLGVKVKETEYDYVYGSRNVVKDPDNPFEDNDDYYSSDFYVNIGRRLNGLLPKGFVVYAEVIGWDGDDPIQTGYTYQIPRGEARIYVYRVTRVGEDGHVTDLSWEQVTEFCAGIGVMTVAHLDVTSHISEPYVSSFLDKRFFINGYRSYPSVDEGMVDEGICIRREGLRPTILKAKSPQFLRHETAMLDKGVADMESADEPVDALVS